MDQDLVIIGGGIHGVGVAQAAAARGYRTVLVEKDRLAAGTSSRSSKLIHGGLRYLESLALGLVRESLRERRILARIAPDLVAWVPFFIPVYADSRHRPGKVRAGLALYALLAGFDATSRFRALPRAEWELLDGLRSEGLRAVFRYWDAQTDDANLTAAVMRSAQELGATLLCPAELVAARREESGYRVRVALDGREEKIRTRVLVNATGPWINQILERFEPRPAPFGLELVQGTHILVEGELRAGIYYLEAPADRRAVFVMPWQGNTLVGTTESVYRGDPGAVTPLDEEIEYLLATLCHYFPGRGATVLTSFAGLRVLPAGGANLSRRSRETTLIAETPTRPHLLTIAGGKLTGYRATAEKVLDRLRSVLPPRSRNLDTAELPLRLPAIATAPPRLERDTS